MGDKKCLVCDFGGSSVKYALVDDQATLEQTGKLPAPLDSVSDFINTVVTLYSRFRTQIEGVAISMPGYIDPNRGYLSEAGAYRALYHNSIPELLKPHIPVPVVVENDGKCAALAEAWKGALAGCSDGAVIILGSGIAGGIIKGGKIHSGRDFAAGELSYLITDPTSNSQLGCAYMSAAMHGLTYRTCKAKNLDLSVQDSASTLQWLDEKINMPYADPTGALRQIKADGVQFFKWLDEGDPAVGAIYQNFISSLALVVHNVQICFAPEKIVIGGGLSLEDRIFTDLDKALNRIYRNMELGPQLHAAVVRSRYRNECNLVGAMYHYLLHSSDPNRTATPNQKERMIVNG